MTKPLYARSVSSLVRAVHEGRITRLDVVNAHLERIEAVNSEFHAVVEVLDETARATAREADRLGQRRPLEGVPFSVKLSLDVAGSATTLGVAARRRAIAPAHAPVVERLVEAGAIPVARTNLSEMGLRIDGGNPLHGRTLNPWHPSRTPGGSSAGDAVAVATGMVAFGVGSDLGGSLRSPSSCCALAGLKPTVGRVAWATTVEPVDPGLGMQLMHVVGPIARTAEDLARVFPVIAGRHARDPRSVDAPLTGNTEARRAAVAGNTRAVAAAAQRLEAAGWDVEEAPALELDTAVEVWGGLVHADLEVLHPMIRPIISPHLDAYLGRLRNQLATSMSVDRLHRERSRLIRLWSSFLEDGSVLVTPTLLQAPWLHDADLDPVDGVALIAGATPWLLPASVLGLPSVAVPTGLTGTPRLPTGVQVHADLWREDRALVAATIAGVQLDEPLLHGN